MLVLTCELVYDFIARHHRIDNEITWKIFCWNQFINWAYLCVLIVLSLTNLCCTLCLFNVNYIFEFSILYLLLGVLGFGFKFLWWGCFCIILLERTYILSMLINTIPKPRGSLQYSFIHPCPCNRLPFHSLYCLVVQVSQNYLIDLHKFSLFFQLETCFLL